MGGIVEELENHVPESVQYSFRKSTDEKYYGVVCIQNEWRRSSIKGRNS